MVQNREYLLQRYSLIIYNDFKLTNFNTCTLKSPKDFLTWSSVNLATSVLHKRIGI